ncbi:MFS sugar transporter, partial [Salmonella enterica subsp. enterica serovar Braenderup]
MSGVYLFTQFACFLVIVMGNDSNLLIVFYVQIMP